MEHESTYNKISRKISSELITLNNSLRDKAFDGAVYSFLELSGKQVIQFAIYIVLVRLLSPKDYGILAILSIFIVVANCIVDSGFGQALIQKQNSTKTDESTVFFFNLLVGAFLTLLLFFSAPLIANFYGISELRNVTRVYSIWIFIASFGVVQNSLLAKRLEFKKRMIASSVSVIIGGLAGISLAFWGFGVWALVFQSISSQFVNVFMLWVLCSWRPCLVFSMASIRKLGVFGINVLVSGILSNLFEKSYIIVIAKFFSVVQLGFYQNSQQVVVMLSQTLALVIAQVNFPVISKIQEDHERVKKVFKKILKTTLFITSPIMICFIALAPQLVPLGLGKKWEPCIPYMRLLCLPGLLYPIHLLNLSLLKAVGRSDLTLRLEFIKRTLTMLSIAICIPFGIIGLIYGQIATSLFALILNTYYTQKIIGAGMATQLKWLFFPLFVSVLTGLTIFTVSRLPIENLFWATFVQIVAGFISYTLVMRIIKDEDFNSLFFMFLSKIKIKESKI